MSVAQSTKDAVDAAVESCERVKDRAKSISKAVANRPSRARTNPFVKIAENEFDDENSLVTSIENVIATSSPAIDLKKEE